MASVDQTRLEAHLDRNGIGILDGGLATYLEDGLNFDLSKGPLWSARLLDEKEADVADGKGRKGIFDAHLHYLEAGAAVIGTATYQASRESFARAQYAETAGQDLMTKAVDIAAQSLHHFVTSNEASTSASPLISLSLGPYGGMLSNGAEYTGDYRKTHLPDSDPERNRQPSVKEMAEFHQRRIETFMRHPSWDKVGLLALETIPRVDEALAFRIALENICLACTEDGTRANLKPVYLSFAFPDDQRLPWPARDLPSRDDDRTGSTEDEEMHWLVQIAVGPCVQGRTAKWPIAGFGINCTKPSHLTKLVERMSSSLATLNRPEREGGIDLEADRLKNGAHKPLLFLYPDGGLLYDAVNKAWIAPSDASVATGTAEAARLWADNLMRLARDTVSSCPQWKGVFVGGCCKSGTEEIKALCQSRLA